MLRKQILIVFGIVFVAIPAAAGQGPEMHGASCESLYGSSRASIDHYSSFGAFNNNSSNAVSVACPLQFSNPDTSGITTVDPWAWQVYYYTSSGLGDISCTPYLVKSGTTSVVSFGTRYSCSTPGGCASGGSNWTGGRNNLGWVTVGNSTADVISMEFECSLPRYNTSTFGFAAIRSYQVYLNSP